MAADHSPKNVARPHAAARRGGLVDVHGLEDAEIDLGAVPAIEAGRRRDMVERLELGEAAIEVEAVYRVMGDGVDRVVRALALIDVGQGDVQHDRDRGKAPELGELEQHPTRQRIFEQEDVADLLELPDDRAGIARILPALVRIKNHLHAGRVLLYARAPTADIVLEVA